jgi:hypothetical protein
MNMRSLTIVLGAITAFALGACTITSTSGGAGGSTSATGATSAATGTASGGTGGASGTGTTSTGTAMCDPTYTCAMAITTPDGNPAELCDGAEKTAFNALAACTCDTGACATACKDSACVQLEASTDCKACLSNSTTGCGKEFTACATGG